MNYCMPFCVKSILNSVHRVRGTTGELKYGIKIRILLFSQSLLRWKCRRNGEAGLNRHDKPI